MLSNLKPRTRKRAVGRAVFLEGNSGRRRFALLQTATRGLPNYRQLASWEDIMSSKWDAICSRTTIWVNEEEVNENGCCCPFVTHMSRKTQLLIHSSTANPF